MKKNRYAYMTLKYGLYALVLCISYIIGASPALPEYRPILVLPMVVALSLYEGEFVGGLYGALAGLLLDYGAMTLFGINAMLLLILGCAAGLISLYLFQRSLRSSLILTASMALLQGVTSFFLLYGMWRLTGSGVLLLTAFLPTLLLTTLFAPVYYYGVGFIYRYFEPLCRPVWEMS